MSRKKLTLHIELDIMERAREVARRRGTTVSEMVESYLRQITFKDASEDLPPLTRSLVGILADSGLRESDHRAHAAEKHGPN